MSDTINIKVYENTPEGMQAAIAAAENRLDQKIDDALLDSTAIGDPTIPIPVDVTGNAHCLGVGPGTYANWGGLVVPANNTATLKRIGGVFYMSLTLMDLSGKLNVSDVINSLTSAETAKALSAAQGKFLNENKANITYVDAGLALKLEEKDLLEPDFSTDYNTEDFSTLTLQNPVTGVDAYVNKEARVTIEGVLSAITVKSSQASVLVLKCITISAGVVTVLHTFETITLLSGINTYSIDDNFILPVDSYISASSEHIYYNNSTNGSFLISGSATATNSQVRVSVNFEITTLKLAYDIETKTSVDLKLSTKLEVIEGEKKNNNVDFSVLTLQNGDTGDVFYVNKESKITRESKLKKITVKASGSNTLNLKCININGNVATVLHTFPVINLIAGTNDYNVDYDFNLPAGSYISVSSYVIYYNNTTNGSFRVNNDNNVSDSPVRVSVNFEIVALVPELNILQKALIDNQVLLYGTSIMSNDYPWFKKSLESITGAEVYNGGFSGATASQLCENSKLQRIWDYYPNKILLEMGGNQDGAINSVGTFTNINGEPVVTEPDASIDYLGTYYIQAISYVIQRILLEYENFRERANLTGLETELEKEAKIDAVKKVELILLSGFPQKRYNDDSEFSKPSNWKRKEDAIKECGLKYGVKVIDIQDLCKYNMTLEPYWAPPTDPLTNNGLYFMDGLHPNKYGYELVSRKICESNNW